MPYKTTDIVAAIWEMGLVETAEVLGRIAKRFPEAPGEQIVQAFKMVASEEKERLERERKSALVGAAFEVDYDEMIDWFRRTHPTEARRIEAEVEAEIAARSSHEASR